MACLGYCPFWTVPNVRFHPLVTPVLRWPKKICPPPTTTAQKPFRASPISPDEIAMAPCDYVALGHVHVFRDVSQNGVPAYYSGAPSGSQTKTVAIVDLDPVSGVSVLPLEIVLD